MASFRNFAHSPHSTGKSIGSGVWLSVTGDFKPGNIYLCAIGYELYAPSTFVYTDPYGLAQLFFFSLALLNSTPYFRRPWRGSLFSRTKSPASNKENLLMMRLYSLLTLIAGGLLSAAPPPQPFHRPLTFEENHGQAPSEVKWIGQGPGYKVLLTREGATIVSAQKADQIVRMRLAGGHPWKDIAGVKPTGGVSNYLNHRDERRSLTHISHFGGVNVPNVYQGIDLVLYANSQGDLEYDLAVAPKANPIQIQVAFEGMRKMSVDDTSGDLVLTMPDNSELRQPHPRVYQDIDGKRVEIASGYRLLDRSRVAFTLAAYDQNHTLVIDPRVLLANSFGGSGLATAMAVDSDGNMYLTGSTYSDDFPVTNGSHRVEPLCEHSFGGFCGGFSDIFLAKVNAAGSLVFATYVDPGQGRGIAVDSSGIYLTGLLLPRDDGHFNGAHHNMNGDTVIYKFSLSGDTLIYNSISAVDGIDFGSAIAVDSHQNAWVAGATYPGTDLSKGQVRIIELDPSGRIIYDQESDSDDDDVAYDIAVDPSNRPWITGKTCGSGFPTTDGVFHRAGFCQVFVMQLETNGTARMVMVFGSGDADNVGVAVVPNGNNVAYITGYVNSFSFPTTPFAFQPQRNFPGTQGFVTLVDSSTPAGRILSSTFLEADGTTFPKAIAFDHGVVYVAGRTSSSHFPGATDPPVDTTSGFVAQLTSDLSQLQTTTLLGVDLVGVAVRKPNDFATDIFTAGLSASGHPFVVKYREDTPASAVANLPAHVSTPTFAVSWAGSDPARGTLTYDVFVSDNGASVVPFLTATTLTSAPFTGIPGHTYGFYSIATNSAGVKEPPKNTFDMVVTISAPPPTILCTGGYFVVNGARSTLAFNVSVNGSNSTFAFNFRNATQAGQFVSTTTSQISVNGNSATFSGQGTLNGQPGYSFTVTAKDGGGPGSGLDTVSIAITGPDNYSYSAGGTIVGGDIVVHQ